MARAKKESTSATGSDRKGTTKRLGRGINALMKKESPTTVKISIDEIVPNPYQPRTNFNEEALQSLQDSIKEHGLVQPIIVRKGDEGYELVAGERRWRACKALGMMQVEAIIKDYSTEETTEIALVENLQREDLDPIEEACAFKKLMDTFQYTQEEISQKLGMSRSHVANMVRLLNLSKAVQSALSAGDITIGQARPLLALQTKKKQDELLRCIIEEGLTARQVESLVQRGDVSASSKKPDSSGAHPYEESAEVRQWRDRLKVSLGTPVDIRFKKGKKVKGKIEIAFSSKDELERLLAYLEGEEELPTVEKPSFTI